MNLDNAIFIALVFSEIVVIGLLIYRRVWRTLPIFCFYVVWDVLSNVGVYAVMRYLPAQYFKTYFVDTAIDSALLFCVLVELAWSVLRPLRPSLPRGALVIVGLLILAAGAAIWPFAAFSDLAHVTWKPWLVMIQLQHSVSILRVMLFVLLAAGSQLLSIGWRDRELQVATGLGIYSLVSLTVAMVNLHLTAAPQYRYLNRIVIGSYICSLLYWAFSFAQREAERREFTPEMRKFLLAMAGAARSTRVALSDSQTNKPRKHDDR